MANKTWYNSLRWNKDSEITERFHEYFKEMGFAETTEHNDVPKYAMQNREGCEIIECSLYDRVFMSERILHGERKDLFQMVVDKPDDIQFFFERGYRHCLFFDKHGRGL